MVPVKVCAFAAAERAPALAPRQKRLLKNKRRWQQDRQQQQEADVQQQQRELPKPAGAGQGIALQCPHFASCSGCTLDTHLEAPSLLSAARAFFEDECGLPIFRLHVGSIQGWRHRARLAVRHDSAGQAVLGLFKKGTHSAVAIPSCLAHHTAINAAAQVLQHAVAACQVEPYDESSGSGELRYVQLTVVETPTQHCNNLASLVQLVLVWNAEFGAEASSTGSSKRLAALADHLWRQAAKLAPDGGGGLIHSVWANYQPSRTNTILGPRWRLLHGTEMAWAHLGGADICFGPGSFMQANFAAMDCCLAAMQQHVPLGSAIADLHAGVGTIGLSLAATRQPRSVRFVEIDSQGLPPFQHSAARLRQRFEGNMPPGASDTQTPAMPALEYHVAAAGSDPGRWCQGCDVVVCDPPRKGLEPSLVSWLCSPAAACAGVRRLLYLSCGFPALQRDARTLLGSGQWRLRHAESYLFFPGTDHIETLAVFDTTL